jgi:hypothetical protein
MLVEIETKIRKAEEALKKIHYSQEQISAREFHDYMMGETFSGDTTSISDVLGSEFLMAHELVEMSELKKMGIEINKRTLMESPKPTIYAAHFTAMEQELNYALLKKDISWIKTRLQQHKASVLENDPHLSEELRPKAEEILAKFNRLIATLKQSR